MAMQTGEISQSFWREQAGRWLSAQPAPGPTTTDGERPDENRDPDPPPPAAPGARFWPRILPGL